MYILKCSDGTYYTGSTIDLIRRLNQHNIGEGANHTANRLPVVLVYVEVYVDIKKAFWREKQIQGWSRKKKEALMKGFPDELKKLAECMNQSHSRNHPFDSAQGDTQISNLNPQMRNYFFNTSFQPLASICAADSSTFSRSPVLKASIFFPISAS